VKREIGEEDVFILP